MHLYLVRHGEAVAKEVDADRPLSKAGRTQAEAMAAFLKPLGIDVAAVWHSTKTRARQTAEILAPSLHAGRGLVLRKGIKPLDDVGPTLHALHKAEFDLMIVGHMPHLSVLASTLLAGQSGCDFVDFPTASVACLARQEHGWKLLWLVGPDQVA
ncbi:MAG: phosphohistidine phosphatase SixA [Planctomycetes bacterium]|nr:phosphohistidine phosphatase SixA [Planctomycetota bacterium]